jgi:hypothetical protein
MVIDNMVIVNHHEKHDQKGKCKMREITVTIDYRGKSYLTNVIADRDTTEEEILKMAREQVLKQWTI